MTDCWTKFTGHFSLAGPALLEVTACSEQRGILRFSRLPRPLHKYPSAQGHSWHWRCHFIAGGRAVTSRMKHSLARISEAQNGHRT